MSPGDRPDLPLATEPAIVLRTATIGEPAPGPVQPVAHEPALGEEPALRFEPLGGPSEPDDRALLPRADTAAPGRAPGPHRTLPTTGSSVPVLAALGSIGLAWVLKRLLRA